MSKRHASDTARKVHLRSFADRENNWERDVSQGAVTVILAIRALIPAIGAATNAPSEWVFSKHPVTKAPRAREKRFGLRRLCGAMRRLCHPQ
jgi:hypothetical protein